MSFTFHPEMADTPLEGRCIEVEADIKTHKKSERALPGDEVEWEILSIKVYYLEGTLRTGFKEIPKRFWEAFERNDDFCIMASEAAEEYLFYSNHYVE